MLWILEERNKMLWIFNKHCGTFARISAKNKHPLFFWRMVRTRVLPAEQPAERKALHDSNARVELKAKNQFGFSPLMEAPTLLR